MGSRTVAALTAGVVVAGLLAAGSASATAGVGLRHGRVAAPAGAQIRWHRCARAVVPGGQCGRLAVPLDPAQLDGPTITIAVARVLHTREPYRGVVFTNPGGPGSAGRDMATLGGSVPGHVAQTYDWYGIDPRGTGASTPSLSCDGRYFGWDRPPYVPRTHRIMAAWRAKAQGYARACGHAAARRLLAHVHTTDTAADLDALRAAIGADRITFYGGSYGTYLGQVYATLYPDRVQALILDGVVDPRHVFWQLNLDQDRAFETSFAYFRAWVARHHRAYHLGTTKRAVYRSYHRLERRLARHPAGGGRIGPDELADVVLFAGYVRFYFPLIASAWSALARHGDASGIAGLYRASSPVGRGADNAYAMYLATECTDALWPTRWAAWRRTNWRLHRKAPFLTWANAWYNAPCRTWPVPAQRPVTVTGQALDAPVLLLSETRDPATPYSGALEVRRLFPTSALVAGVGGTSHAVALSGIACTDDTIAAVLRDGTLPVRRPGNRADKRCRPVPAPSPGAGRARTARIAPGRPGSPTARLSAAPRPSASRSGSARPSRR